MLIQFSVTNFLSFRDEVILSLSTNKDDSHKENLLSYKNERILPSVATIKICSNLRCQCSW